MKNANKKFLISLVLIVSALLLFKTGESLADDKYINGKVVYVDSQEPVNNAAIDVLLYSEPNKSESQIGHTVTNSQGEFRISVPNQTSDRIKIMAYPNEDNSQNLFQEKVVIYDGLSSKRADKYDIIIEVKRTKY